MPHSIIPITILRPTKGNKEVVNKNNENHHLEATHEAALGQIHDGGD